MDEYIDFTTADIAKVIDIVEDLNNTLAYIETTRKVLQLVKKDKGISCFTVREICTKLEMAVAFCRRVKGKFTTGDAED